MRTAIRLVLISLLIVAVHSAASLAGAPAAAASDAEAAFVREINAERSSRGLVPLRVRSDLASHADRHSAAMAERAELFHTPDLSVICCYRSVAENVGYGGSVAQVHGAFMNSSGHRANILDPEMRQVGIGVVRAGGQLWVTEVFRQPNGVTPPSVGAGSPSDGGSGSSAGAGPAGASRQRARAAAPTFAEVLQTRTARLADRLSAPDSRDPLARTLAWSGRMRALCAPRSASGG